MPKKEKAGVVISDKMEKTVVVLVENRTTHRRYGKVIIKTKKYKVHDPSNDCSIGDFVIIEETRPISKTKRWKLKCTKQKVSKIDTSNIGE